MFQPVNPKQSFPEMERQIIEYWKENALFQKSIDTREGAPEFDFYDGPPFATGTPHYGHILAGTMKDVIPRYQTMLGKRVERKFGWDCHGVPIEGIVEKKMGIKSKREIDEEIGVFAFNEACRANVFTYTDDWEKSVERMGRWVDMKRDYKTMDLSFMESVWWVFQELYKKGLIYEDYRVVPYSVGMGTPLSNFEVNQGYMDKQDKTITVKFRVNHGKLEKMYHESTGIIIKNSKGEVLFGKRLTNGLLTLAGGKLDAGEDPKVGALRELEEETGIKLDDLKLFSCNYSFHSGKDWKEYVYEAEVSDDIVLSNPEAHKFEDWAFYDLTTLNLAEVEGYDIQIIEQLLGKKSTSSVHSTGEKYILAWTTTPWTLVANLGLAVGKDVVYAEIFDKKSGETYVLAKSRIGAYYKDENEYTLVREYPGSCLVGMKYDPLYQDFQVLEDLGTLPVGQKLGKNVYSVVLGHHVTDDNGTGIVHIAPAYGEDDMLIGKEHDLGIVAHIDDNGYTCNLLEHNKMWVFDFNEKAIETMKLEKRSVKIETITHSYPHCWRTDIPLIYRAISAWYVNIEKIKPLMLSSNDQINWVPENLKYGRFGKWLEGARDWNISRNRYWGSAIPVWQSKDKSEQVCIGSVEELYEQNKPYGQITKIIFVRHGRTDYNDAVKFDCQNKARLSEMGNSQAQQLKEVFANESIDVVYSSPFQRCIDTITPLAKSHGLEIITDEALREIFAPDLQDQTYKCRSFQWDNGFGGGETIKAGFERVQAFLKEILAKHPGKTIVVCGHGDSTFHGRVMIRGLDPETTYNTRKFECGLYLENNLEKHPLSAMYGVDYVYTHNQKQVDLHKHFIDDVLIPNPTGVKAKRVLGVHGWHSLGDKNSPSSKWYFIRQSLEQEGIHFDVPTFDPSENTSYAVWKEELEKYDVKSYDTIVSASFGCPVILQYLHEKNIHVKRLVLQAPSGLVGNEYLEKIQDSFTFQVKNLQNYCDELIVVCSRDDESTSASYAYCKKFVKESQAIFVQVDGFGHRFHGIGGRLLGEIAKNGAPLQRIPEVLDCWFESGSMPYASKHYPFENKESFKFPADFIAEGVDQTRGWFYTLVVLGAALFGKNPFSNVIVNGIVLAEDGKKMSKRLKNYTDPSILMDHHGADAMRFYLMNSPVVQAEDLRFTDAGVEEVVKKVILPLWNTYSFFTTYANLDQYQADTGNIYYVRHGQTDNNLHGVVNGGDDDIDLNQTGVKQAHELGKKLSMSGVKFDMIVTSPMTRTKHTASILQSYLPGVEIIEDEAFREQSFGEFRGMSHEQIKEKFGCKDDRDLTRVYRNNSLEPATQFEARVQAGYLKLAETYQGKNVLLISHGGVFRPINRYLNALTHEEAFYTLAGVHNGAMVKLPRLPKYNPLDRWIVSELQVLIGEVRVGLDAYKINDATKPIVRFMDQLTNWYIRRSRKRFWKSENDSDKLEAYETLYEVLTDLSKVIAPFMPFVSETVYRGLTGNESVHLSLFPEKKSAFVFKDLNESMQETQDLITLGLSARSQAKIRVRQPLSYIKITHELPSYYQEILKEELNVKEVLVFGENEIPKQICKPNARLIGPKFGGKVKEIISLAKAGAFVLMENGTVQVAGEVLLVGEFELEFVSEGASIGASELLESGMGKVVALHTEVTRELKLEGYARDLIRQIQDSRKEADYKVDDRIKVMVSSSSADIIEALDTFQVLIQSETLSARVHELSSSDFSKVVEIEGGEVKIELSK